MYYRRKYGNQQSQFCGPQIYRKNGAFLRYHDVPLHSTQATQTPQKDFAFFCFRPLICPRFFVGLSNNCYSIYFSTRPDQFKSKTSSSDLDTAGKQGVDLSTDALAKDISEMSLKDAGSPLGDGGGDEEDEDEESDSDNDDDLFVNTNRPTVTYFYSDSEEEEEEDNEER